MHAYAVLSNSRWRHKLTPPSTRTPTHHTHTHTLLHCTQVSVYTFGAPRAGNHGFARLYERTVPDTWHVINDQV
jgi:hypothetical protein